MDSIVRNGIIDARSLVHFAPTGAAAKIEATASHNIRGGMADEYGSARWATPDDLRRGRWLDGIGPPLGVNPHHGGWRQRLGLASAMPDELRLNDDTHHFVVSSAGSGKYVSSLGVLLYDFLMRGDTGACVVIDPKGEALDKIGKLLVRPFARPEAPDHLADFPQHYTAAWLDPYDVCKTGFSWSLNFLRLLGTDQRHADDDARLLAQALIGGGNKVEHWDESARNFVGAVMLYVAQHPDEHGRRDLYRVRRIVTLGWEGNPDDPAHDDLLAEKPETLQSIAAKIAAWHGGPDAARNPASTFLGLPERTRESCMLGIYRDTGWIDSSAMSSVLRDDDNAIDLDAAVHGRTMLFVVLPDKQAESHKAWLRLVVAACSNVIKSRGVVPTDWRNKRHVFIDEFPSLGQLEVAARDLAVARGFNVQYHVYVQNIGQLQKIYGAQWDAFIANAVVQAFHVGEVNTRDYLQKMMGSATIPTQSRSYQSGQLWASSSSEGLATRPLMFSEEIGRELGKDSNMQILLRTGQPPIKCQKLRVFDWKRYDFADKGFSLADVWHTLGRAPADAAEEARFLWWRA